jgi:hypothetical protein
MFSFSAQVKYLGGKYQMYKEETVVGAWGRTGTQE